MWDKYFIYEGEATKIGAPYLKDFVISPRVGVGCSLTGHVRSPVTNSKRDMIARAEEHRV